jgi:NAD(P)H-hydrate epimerase
MAGAARLAGEAALRSGAGLVSVATRAANVSAIVEGRPELMCRGVEDMTELDALLERATVVAVGPGLGQDDWARTVFGRALGAGKPLVLDADALNLLAQSPRQQDHWILTPHPGEAARLLGLSTGDVQADRLGSLAGLNERYGGCALLKGHGTLIGRRSQGSPPWLIRGGNPGMATAGMGDVLTGITAAVYAQCARAGAELDEIAAAAAWLHATAGDRAAARGERGLIAGDLFAELRLCLNS